MLVNGLPNERCLAAVLSCSCGFTLQLQGDVSCKFSDKTLAFRHLIESFLAVLSSDTICCAVQSSSNFSITLFTLPGAYVSEAGVCILIFLFFYYYYGSCSTCGP